MQHLNEHNVFTKTITIIQIMNEMCTWTNLVHRTNIGIYPLSLFFLEEAGEMFEDAVINFRIVILYSRLLKN